ncbi:MAG: ATP-dependent Clp protease proteolytic subunit 1 [Chlamydiae bacterium]|nr:ATP-dependent Clp protease proteolytic subunit 1 [Chlamydiota bacterium]
MSQEEVIPYRSLDDSIDATLLKSRRIFFSNVVDSKSVSEAIKKLWYLEITDPGKPILFIINSPGGSVLDGLALIDQVKMITSPITTLVTGLAASMGTLIGICALDPKRRLATPSARFMIHQPRIHGYIQGQASDLEIHARDIAHTHEQGIKAYMEATGKDKATVEKAIDRDNWMSAEEALEFGLIGKIVNSFGEVEL